MDSIASLHKTDNFHFAHLLVVMYEADQIRQQYQAAAFEEGQQRQQDDISSALVGQASQKVLQVLIEFILSFIQQNKQSIVQSLQQPAPSDERVNPLGSVTGLRDFTFAKFLISCAHEQSAMTAENSVHKVDTLLRYLKPMHGVLAKSALLK